jgi:hypothetical protein
MQSGETRFSGTRFQQKSPSLVPETASFSHENALRKRIMTDRTNQVLLFTGRLAKFTREEEGFSTKLTKPSTFVLDWKYR